MNKSGLDKQIKDIVLHENHTKYGYSPDYVYHEVKKLLAQAVQEALAEVKEKVEKLYKESLIHGHENEDCLSDWSYHQVLDILTEMEGKQKAQSNSQLLAEVKEKVEKLQTFTKNLPPENDIGWDELHEVVKVKDVLDILTEMGGKDGD